MRNSQYKDDICSSFLILFEFIFMLENSEKLLTIKEAASRLQLNPITLYGYIRQGQLKAVKFGRSYRIVEKDLFDFIESNKTF